MQPIPYVTRNDHLAVCLKLTGHALIGVQNHYSKEGLDKIGCHTIKEALSRGRRGSIGYSFRESPQRSKVEAAFCAQKAKGVETDQLDPAPSGIAREATAGLNLRGVYAKLWPQLEREKEEGAPLGGGYWVRDTFIAICLERAGNRRIGACNRAGGVWYQFEHAPGIMDQQAIIERERARYLGAKQERRDEESDIAFISPITRAMIACAALVLRDHFVNELWKSAVVHVSEGGGTKALPVETYRLTRDDITRNSKTLAGLNPGDEIFMGGGVGYSPFRSADIRIPAKLRAEVDL